MNDNRNYFFRIICNTLLKYLILAYPILISIEKFIPQVGTLLTALVLLILIVHSCERKTFWLRYPIIFALLYITVSMSTENERHSAHIKAIIIIFLAMDSYWTGLSEKIYSLIKEHSSVLKTQLWIIVLLNTVLLVLPYGYSGAYSDEWGVNAYCGMYADPHQAAYRFCVLMVVTLIIASFRYSKFDYLLIFLYLYLTMMTAARVPAVLAISIAGLFFLDHKPSTKNDTMNKLLSFLILIILGTFALYIIMMYTAFGSKILGALQSVHFDNGRSGLRDLDIKLFQQSDLLHKLFGYGTDYVIMYHGSIPYGAEIWSHNDFMAILCGEGLLLFVLYCILWIKYCVHAIKLKNIMYLIMVITCGLVAFFNGLYIHSRFSFIMPVLFVYMHYRKKQFNTIGE